VFWKRPTIGCALLGRTFRRAILCILFGMDRGNRGFQVFQRKFELLSPLIVCTQTIAG
jgi:hypothetical protein